MNPLAICSGYYSGSIKIAIFMEILGFLIIYQLIKQRKAIKSGMILSQNEMDAMMKEGEQKLRAMKANAGKEFANKLVTNLKAMKKEGGKLSPSPAQEKMEIGKEKIKSQEKSKKIS